ncbi:nuclear RNA export factor 1-like [Rhopalosiphum padi]|uniref:nuclear RNA export factor 1-like n=1 Tax=Rhopalosiphum padi TaxID=40932 RepID=UPI00298EA492|nr:nuclear RNA export factor 1-like [Rhopalosiphum padi]XP_060839179.1 nuclear RNA export factor 1-like [Rhopalosiphum padi]
MAGRSRGRNNNGRFHNINSRNERNNEHDDRTSRPSTRGGGGYLDRHGYNKKVTFKANNRGGNHFRKSWEGKTDLVRDQLDSEYSNRNGPPRNNSGRRSFPERNHGRGGHGNFRNLSWSLKESSTGWYSVFVPNVEDSDEVLKIIQTYITPVIFYPYNKQYFDNALRFLVDDYKVAKALHNTSYKITQRDDRKLVIKVLLYSPPRGPISFTPVSSEVREKMIEAMATRYNPSTKSLDLSRFYACSLFTDNQLFVPLNRPAVLLAALNIVAQHTKHDLYGLSLENNHIYLGEGLIWIRRLFPELKVLDLAGNKFSDLKELRCLSGYTIEVLNLSRNPVCDTEDKERYKRDVQQFFPMLTKLDNSELPSRYSAIGSKFKMPINLGNCYPIPEGHNPELPNPVMSLVESFLAQYYERYDNQVSRQMVSEAYHENATFTLSSGFLFKNVKGSLSQYLHEGRNFLKSDRNKQGRGRFLHKGKENIINFLDKLPKSKHDLGSFIVDVPLATAAMVQIVLNGVFAEDFKETNYRHVYRSFCRTFCIVPVGSGWSIISDMLFITIVTDELLLETSKRFHIFKPKPVSSKRNNSNGNSNQNVTMFMEDTDEMAGMESSSSSQQSTPNYPPPTYQQSTFSSYQSSQMTAPQQPSPYQGGTSTPQIQQMAPAATVNFQPDSQRQPTASFNMFNSISPSTAAFPTTSTPASLPVNQLSTEAPVNLISDVNANPDKMSLVKSFSNESGMNNEWAKKCLEENGWDYAKAAACFSELKANIPPAAFIH